MMKNVYFDVDVSRYVPEKNFHVRRPASFQHPRDYAVMFLTEKHMVHREVLESVENCLVFLPDGCETPETLLRKHAVVICRDPHGEYCRFFRDNNITYLPEKESVKVVDEAWIADKAQIGKNVTIMPGAYIGGQCVIRDRAYIGAGAKLVGEVEIGENVVIRENTVIGADGLTTDRENDGKAITMPQFGKVIVERDVQIGANVVIARGAIDETRICRGTKIDSCTFISHNVRIDEDTFVVGETILFGSSSVGKRCLVSGNATLMNLVHIGDESVVGAGAVVVRTVPEKSVVKGNPAK